MSSDSCHSEEPVTLQSLMQQLISMSGRMDTLSVDVKSVKADVKVLKENNKSSSSSGQKILCPLGCGTEFKKVRELPVAVCNPLFTMPTGDLLVRSFVQSYYDQ
jgi:hypothetical protein